MKEKLSLVSYGVQEITMAEAREINGGIGRGIAGWLRVAREALSPFFETAYTEGRRQAGCFCCN